VNNLYKQSLTHRFKDTNKQRKIKKFSVKYKDKLTTHPNELASTLSEEEEPNRLKRFKPTDLTTRLSYHFTHM
jgi:hypothetical protein